MDEQEFRDAEEQYRQMGTAHRVWVIPILTALEKLGGRAAPRVVRREIGKAVSGRLTKKQWAYILRTGRIGWARLGMRDIGLLAGEPGTWEPTEVGRAFLDHLRDEDQLDPNEIPEEVKDPYEGIKTETLPATSFAGYHVPVLRAMADGINAKQALLGTLYDRLQKEFLPADLRTMPKGQTVWQFRASWALSDLKSKGDANNPSLGRWKITEAGLERLKKEEEKWTLKDYHNSKVLVRSDEITQPTKPVDVPSGSWSIDRWQALSATLRPQMFSALDARIRPDLGPNPAAAISRNVILYGPPGTGKTFIAKQVATALTGDDEAGPDSRWRIVQFHPSYAYEDFIQGLKPDLEETELRYALSKGPFLQLCEAAEQDPDRFYVLLIDEINRGDPARIFGELLYALEYRGQAVDLPLGSQLTVPLNLVIVGTMNSVDRSVALVDYALRRRFGFVRIEPDPEVILSIRGSDQLGPVSAELFRGFNKWLASTLDSDHTLGHSYFLNPAIPLSDSGALERVWNLDIRPLLEEFFFGEPQALQEARQQWNKCLSEALADEEEEEPNDADL